MKQWEYAAVCIHYDLSFAKVLNEYGSEGWELVQVYEEKVNRYWIFKRKKKVNTISKREEALREMLYRDKERRVKEVKIWVEGHSIKEPSNLPTGYKAGHKACIDELLENCDNLPIIIEVEK